jgi:S1-C subfamily serine protease
MSYADEPMRRAAAPAPRWPLVVLIALLTALVVRLWTTNRQNALFDADAAPRPVEARGDLAADEKSTIELFHRESPSVVFITTSAVRRNSFNLNLTEIPQGSGSGFVWDQKGHIVTNYHVIQQADTAQVTLADRSAWQARLVGVAPDNDLAVLKIEAPAAQLRPIDVGTSQDLQVGQKVFAIGNPFGLDQTLTTGIISGLGREIESVSGRPIQGVIQTDAAINPGNSGGPLLDSAGRLIGVNTAIFSPSGAYAGVGFAVPVDTVQRIVPDLIRYGKVVRPGLGIVPAEDEITRRLGLQGALVINVADDGAAARAGLRPTRLDATGQVQFGDVIVELAGKPVRSRNDLYKALDGRKVGETVKIKVARGGEIVELDITLQEL